MPQTQSNANEMAELEAPYKRKYKTKASQEQQDSSCQNKTRSELPRGLVDLFDQIVKTYSGAGDILKMTGLLDTVRNAYDMRIQKDPSLKDLDRDALRVRLGFDENFEEIESVIETHEKLRGYKFSYSVGRVDMDGTVITINYYDKIDGTDAQRMQVTKIDSHGQLTVEEPILVSEASERKKNEMVNAALAARAKAEKMHR